MICYFTPEDYGSFTAISTTFSGRYAEKESVARRTRSAWRKSHRKAREDRLIHQIHQLKIYEFTSNTNADSLSKDFYMFPANLIAAKTRFLMLGYARNITPESHEQKIETFLYFIYLNANLQKDPKAAKTHMCLLIDLLQLQPFSNAHKIALEIISRIIDRQDLSKESLLAQSRIRSFLNISKTISQNPNISLDIPNLLVLVHKKSLEYYLECINSKPENIAKLSDYEFKDAFKLYIKLLQRIEVDFDLRIRCPDEQRESCCRLMRQAFNELVANI